MDNSEVLLSNLDKLHTTEMGVDRIKRNLCLQIDDVISWCKHMIENKNSNIYKQGKNWYIEIEDCKLTVNARNYTIITAHKIRKA